MTINKSRLCLLVLCLLAVTGCSKTIKPMTTYSYPVERVLIKNYVLNEKKAIAAGDQVLVHKDYYAFKRVINKFTTNQDFSIVAREWSLSGKINELFPVQGIAEDNEKEYYLLQLNSAPGMLGFSLLIDKDGYFSKKATILFPVYGTLKIAPREYPWVVINPPDVKFTLAFEEVVDKSAGFTNFELIYTGKNNQSLTFLYREYTPDDMIRAAYSQNLVYSVDSTTVKFRKIKIRIEKVTDEGIEYTVIED